MKAVLKKSAQAEFVRRKQFVNRGAGTLQDGYSVKHMKNSLRACWTNFVEQKTISPQSVESHLPTAVDSLLGYNMLARWDTRRNAEFADPFSLNLEN